MISKSDDDIWFDALRLSNTFLFSFFFSNDHCVRVCGANCSSFESIYILFCYENLLINSFLIIHHHHHHFFRIQINIITIHSFIHSFISDCCLALHFLSFSLFLLLNYSWTKNEIKLILFSFFLLLLKT